MAEDNVVSINRRAWHDYFIDETYEGIALRGTEVKSVRARKSASRRVMRR